MQVMQLLYLHFPALRDELWLRVNTLILRLTLNVDDEDKDDLEYEDNDNVSEDNDDLVDDEDEAEKEYDAESEAIGAKLFQSEQSSSAWEEVINKYKDIASITHDVEKFSWVHIVYNRRSEAEKVDLVHVISEAVQEISIQGEQRAPIFFVEIFFSPKPHVENFSRRKFFYVEN